MSDTQQKKLNFKMGLEANLKGVKKAPGTIYVTTDKPAMYLDVDANTRIRLGGAVVSVASASALAKLEPWQAGTLYYLKQEDVLVIYDENGNFELINDKWIQQISELNQQLTNTNADLTDLTTLVGTVDTSGEIKTVGAWLANLHSRTGTLEGKVSTAESNITDAQSAITTLQEQVAAIKGDGTDSIGGLRDAIDSLSGTVAGHTASIADLETATNTNASDIATLEQDMTNAQQDIVEAKNQADLGVANAATAQAKANQNAQDISSLDTTVKSHTTELASVGESLTSLQQQITTNSGEITKLKTTDEQLEAAYKAADQKLKEAYEAADTQLQGNINTLSGNLDTEIQNRKDAISEVSTALTTAETNIRKDFAEADAALDLRLDGHDTAIENLQKAVGDGADGLASKVTTLENNVNGLTTRVGTNESDIKTLKENTIPGINSEIKTIKDTMATDEEVAGVKTALEAKIKTAQDAADNAQKDVNALSGTVTSLSATLESDYAKKTEVTKEATSRQEADAALSARIAVFEAKGAHDVAALEGRVSAVETKATNNASAIQTNAGKIQENAVAIADNAENIQENADAIAAMKKDATITTFKGIEDKIRTSIAESDAMVYKGTFGSNGTVTVLPKDALQGHTYKVVSEVDDFVTDVNLKVGDLLIANKDNPSSNADWDYVPSGGEDHNNLTLFRDGTTIKIKDDENDANGSVEIVSGNTSIEVTGADNAITISMVWGTFE